MKSSATGKTKFETTDTKLYVPIVSLSTQDNSKVLEQLTPGFKLKINLNKYQSRVSTERQNQYLYFLIDQGFQWANRLFILLFVNYDDRKVHKRYYLLKVEIKDYNR